MNPTLIGSPTPGDLAWGQALASLGLALAFGLMALLLTSLLRQRGGVIPSPWMGRTWAAFAVVCGLMHLADALSVAWPLVAVTWGLRSLAALLAVPALGSMVLALPYLMACRTPALACAEEHRQHRYRQQLEQVEGIYARYEGLTREVALPPQRPGG